MRDRQYFSHTNGTGIGASVMIHRSERLRLLCRTALLCALLCVLSMITFPIGAVPITLGTLGVFLCGMLLPTKQACLSVLGHLLLGAVGLPVFSSMQGGLGVLVGITGGFLWGYLPAVFVLSFFRRISGITLAACTGILALLLCYLCGTLQFILLTACSVQTALTACVFPFVPFDLLKLSAALYLSHRFRRHL